jgi:beta-lactamase class A
MDLLEEELRAIEETLGDGGTLGVCAVGSGSGETVSYNADVSFPTASVIKAAIVAELYAQVAEGKLAPDRRVTLGAADFVAGSGVLAGLEPGHPFTLAELAGLTISVSDNTASNAVLRAVGGPGVVNRRMREASGHDRYHDPPPRSVPSGPDDPPHTATGTPADMCRFMHAVATARSTPPPSASG